MVLLQEKLEKNGIALESHTNHLYELAKSKSDPCNMDQIKGKSVITFNFGSGICIFDGSDSGFMEKDIVNSQEEILSSGIVFGNSKNGKSLITLIKLPFIEKIPPYTTWIFLDRSADDLMKRNIIFHTVFTSFITILFYSAS